MDSKKLQRKEYLRNYYIKNRERLLLKSRKYRETNPDVIKQRKKDYYEKNKEIINARRREERLSMTPEDKEKERQRHREYRQKHAEEIKKQKHLYYMAHKSEHREAGRKWRKRNRARLAAKSKIYRLLNPGKVIETRRLAEERTGGASFKVYHALKTGRLVRQKCEVCGATKTEAHHDDYNEPLKVRWLCRKHHEEWHKHNEPIYLTSKI